MTQMSESVASHQIGAEETCVLLTPEERELSERRLTARENLLRLGMTVRKWAIANGYNPRLVYKVLDGGVKGNFGKAHEIAVKLGLKDGELSDD
jgi:gp16 family phage-associated protein